jgi:hypothetical protein
MSLDVDALETSFDLIAPRGGAVMDRCYTRVFATELRDQKTMLRGALVLLRESLHALGARRAAYGATYVDYAAGDDARPEYGRKWAAAFAVVDGAVAAELRRAA